MIDPVTRGLPALALLLFAAFAATGSLPARAQPLQVEGYDSLYERILTRPGATVHAEPADGTPLLERPPPFSAFYVFERRPAAPADWVAVGPAVNGESIGWVRADQTVTWNHQMVLSFANPVGRLPVLFFDERQSAITFFEDERLPVIAPETVVQARSGSLPPDSPVISIEPETFVNIEDNLYLLPILSAERVFLASGLDGRVVEIASLPITEEPVVPPAPDIAGEALEDLRYGVVFVVDTTRSMDPYIDRTREAIGNMVDSIVNSDIGGQVSFGMVGFRDNTDGRPDLEYVARTFAPLQWPPDHEGFRTAIEDVRAATVSSRGFNEDGLAGIQAALDLDEWREFDGRFIIYVSDAGLRTPDDPLSSTGMRPEEINGVSLENGVAIFVLHLLTPAGQAYHASAAAQYQSLAEYAGRAPLYFPVANGDVDAFGQQVDRLVGALAGQIDESLAGRMTTADFGDGDEDIGAASRFVGRAVQLAYLARESGEAVPDLFRAWTFDRAMDNPSRVAFDVRVLMTRNQLSNLSDILTQVIETAQTDDTVGSTEFFDMLRGAVGGMIIDGNLAVGTDISSLGDVLGDYLGALPYRSEVLEVTPDIWVSAGPAFRDQLLDGIVSKLRAYRLIFSDVDLWTPLYEGAPEGEFVYPLPLDLLP